MASIAQTDEIKSDREGERFVGLRPVRHRVALDSEVEAERMED